MRIKIGGGLLASVLVAAVASVVLSGQQTPTPAGRGGAPIRLRTTTFTPTRGEAPAIPPGLALVGGPAERGYYLVQFEGPIRDAWKAEAADLGAELLEYVPDFAFKVRMSPGAANRVERLAEVVWVGPFHPAYKLAPDLALGGTRAYQVRLERGANAEAAIAVIAGTGAQVLSRDGLHLTIGADQAQVAAVAHVLDVATIENLRLFQKHNEFGGGIVGAALANAAGYDGSTQTIGVADTGLGNGTAGSAHAHLPPFRISSIFNWPGAADGACFTSVSNDGAVDVDSGHGTHTALTALGGGGLAGEGRGSAPAAHLVFQAVENYAVTSPFCMLFYGLFDGYYLTGIPSDIGELFQQAYTAGARIHSDSWGSAAEGAYTADSANTDDFVWNHPDMTVTFSAGNSGVDFDGDGVVDNGSLNAPATAKNVISVGASENDRQSNWQCDPDLAYTNCAALGGQNDIFTYGATWPGSYPANPLRDDPSAGDREQMAAFSSRGPVDDGRIKPDVVAPGTWMLSGYSDQFQQQFDPAPNTQNGLYQYDGWGHPLNQYYKYMGGTSMSNPLVAGASAVVRDYYQKARAHSASAALVKATLINSAVDLLDENNDGIYDNANPIPNVHEGWGRVDLQAATDGERQYVDQTTGLSTGATSTFTYSLSGAGWPLKVSLAWSDYPSSTAAARNLVNDLDLRVTAPTGETYYGNVFAYGSSQPGGSADRVNNVENVFVAAAASGTWTVEVSGYNVPSGPQPFALVVAGQFDGPDAPTSLVTIVASDAVATESGTTTGAFRVVRSGSTTDALTVHYTVTGTASAGDDYASLSGSVTIAAGASDAIVEIVPIDDTATEADETVVVTLSTDANYRLGSPGAAVVTITSDDTPPDLTISSVTAPSVGGAGETIAVAHTTRNGGGGPAEASQTGFYLSTNVVQDGSDVLLGSAPVGPLAPNGTSTATTDLVIPAGTAAGTYYIVAYADDGREIAETQEGNNTRATGAIKIGPDLQVTALTVPAIGGAGEPIAVTDTTKNVGGGASSASETAFYLSTNGVLDAADISLGARSVPALGAGAVSTVTTSLTIPISTPGGIYYVLATADSGSAVTETNEANNLRVGGQVKVGADLVISAVSAPTSGGAGYAIAVTVTTKNQGGGIAPPSTTTFYLSTDSAFDASDVAFGSRSVPALAANASDSGTTSATIPGSTTTGTYYVIAKADGNGTVVETTENNNTRYSAQVRIGPDLIVTAASGTGTAAAGGTIVVNDTTKNQGGGLAAASHTGFYLSANTVIDETDVRIGDRPVPALAPGATHSASTTVSIPSTSAGGTYYLITKADPDNEVPEASTASNTGPFFTVKIGADLAVASLSGPLDAGAGATIVVTDTTRNQGYGPADESVTGFYLSANAGLDSADTLLGTRAVPALLVGATNSGPASLTIPPSTATGLYYIIAKADVNGQVSEVSEGNNLSYKSLRIGPDLAVSALTLPAKATAGTTIAANNTAKNQGGGDAGASVTAFYLSVNSVLDGSDVFLGNRSVPSLAAGASDAEATSLLIPAGTTAGTYFVLAKADADGAVVETQESNNLRIASFQVTAAP